MIDPVNIVLAVAFVAACILAYWLTMQMPLGARRPFRRGLWRSATDAVGFGGARPAMSESADIELGGVEAARVPETIPVRRSVSVMGDMVRLRDRDSSGLLLSDNGYTPANARRLAAMLLQGADRLDPIKPMTVIDGDGQDTAAP
jgi:hypothetical protein